MSGRKAKALRRSVYGDFSLKRQREYLQTLKGTVFNHPGSLRAIYQQEKKP